MAEDHCSPSTLYDALARTLGDALLEASRGAGVPDWLAPDDAATPTQSLNANLRHVSALIGQACHCPPRVRCPRAMPQASSDVDIICGECDDSEVDLTARDLARASCLGPALVVAAGELGGAKLSAPLSQTVRLALFASSGADVASAAGTFAEAVARLRQASETPLTLRLLVRAVCAPRALEETGAALCSRRETPGSQDAADCAHGAACDCDPTCVVS